MNTRQHIPAPNAIAYSYLRFSSPEQAKGDSVRRQTEMTKAWCERNHIRYDESLSLRDEGISAFTGDHRKNPDRHALAGFLELVRQGKVTRGSYFIIENLDRLTREDTVPAVNLFTGILLAGVRVVQLDPETVYTDRSDSMDVMRAVLEMSRGHSESKNKSRRMSAVWGEKRKQAAERKAVMSRSCPAWLRVEGAGAAAKYVLIPERAAVVRRIFAAATDGHGARAILKQLQADKVKPFRKTWNVSYIKLLLKSRQTFGEFTPRERGKGGTSLQRRPTGSPIAGYYPAAVTEAEFLAAQVATGSRKGKAGRPAKEFVNVFAALLWDGRTCGRLHLMSNQRDGKKVRNLGPYEASNRGGKHVGFPLDAFEGAVINYLEGINPRTVLPAAEAKADESTTLSALEKDIDNRLSRLKARLKEEDEADTILDAVRELEADLRRTREQLAKVKAREAAPTAEAWGEFKSITAALEAAPDLDAARLRLRAVLRRMVESVWCLFMPAGNGPRLAWVQVNYAGTDKRHEFVIAHRPRHGTRANEEHPAVTVVVELAEAIGRGGFDLREAGDAADLEQSLAAIDSDALEALVPSRNQREKRSREYAVRREEFQARHERWAKMRKGTAKRKPMSYGAIAAAEGVAQSTVYKALNPPT